MLSLYLWREFHDGNVLSCVPSEIFDFGMGKWAHIQINRVDFTALKASVEGDN